MVDFSKFEEKIGVSFNNKDLLKQAFTHRSYINEHKKSKLSHNERLEFLGDAVLELVSSDYLYKKFPEEKEGILTAYRAALVNTNTLAEAAQRIDMNSFVLLSKGEAKDTGRARSYILTDVFEAVIGAIFLDQGYEKSEKFISDNLFHLTEDIVENRLWQDAKSYFQEKAQEETGITPNYKTLKETGPDHSKVFVSGVFIGEELVAEGEGVSKQIAEQNAAKKGLENKGWE
ncbi:ribonuclease III [Patescibacteria group bacterium]